MMVISNQEMDVESNAELKIILCVLVRINKDTDVTQQIIVGMKFYKMAKTVSPQTPPHAMSSAWISPL